MNGGWLIAEAHPYGAWCLVPPLASIVLAIATRRVVPSLMAGVVAGVLILTRGDVVQAVPQLLETHLWKNLAEPDHLRIFAFTMLMGAMVSVIHATGGMRGLVNALSPLAKGRRGGQLIGWLLGLIIFFDDYANCLLLGNTLRPLTDRLRISREKLSFLVDSTAAPVSGLAIVSTWVATEIGLIETGYKDFLPPDSTIDGMGVFIATIPYRFYVILMLAWIPFLALLNRDFGPMLAAERAARDGRGHARHPAAVDDQSGVASGPVRHWLYAVIPVLTMIAVTSWLLIASGARELNADVWEWKRWFLYFSKGNSYVALVYASLAGLTSVMVLAVGRGILTWQAAREAAFHGATHVLSALSILWLAWCLSEITKPEYLATGGYLAEWISDRISPAWMPTLIFLISAGISFATGTSWGTMGIMMPITIPVTYQLLANAAGGGTVDPHHPILIASIGSVLAGSIFGDHCSPISDTTVLSSQSSSCDHVAHVWTQLPYSMLIATASVVLGTIPVGFGASPYLMLALGLAAAVGFLAVFGKSVGTVDDSPKGTREL
ncbi:MAG: Na+/H+ antiporter NhaC family protein [Pirellulales bacterium]